MVRGMMPVVRVLQVMQRGMVLLVVGMMWVLEVTPWFLLEGSRKGNIIEVVGGDGEGAVGDVLADGATDEADGQGAAGDARTGARCCR